MADNLFCEQDLDQFVEYWGGNVRWIHDSKSPLLNKRAVTASIFWLLHHPELFKVLPTFWKKCVKQMLRDSKTHIHYYECGSVSAFRSVECFNYFYTLYDLWVNYFNEIFVFQFRYQNFRYLSFSQMADMVAMVL